MRHPTRTAATALFAALVLATGGVAACSKDQGSEAAFCAEVEQVPSLESVLARFSETDPEVLADRIDKARTAYDELAASAPPEISDATEQVVSLVDAIFDAVEAHPDDPAKASAQLRKAMAEHEGIDADRAEVADYAQSTCDVQLDATLSEGGAGSTSSTTSSTSLAGTSATTTTQPGSAPGSDDVTGSTGPTGG